MKNAVVAALLFGACAGAPAAHAQASCADLRRLVQEAEKDFESIIGAKSPDEPGESLYDSRFNLPDADSCVISLDLESLYSCRWEASDEAAAARLADSQIAVMRACFTDWRALGPTLFPPESDIKLINGAVLKTDGDKGELWIEARADRQAVLGRDFFVFTLVVLHERF